MKVAIDLTRPVEQWIRRLVQDMIALAPDDEFVLLTATSCPNDLDGPTVRQLVVVDDSQPPPQTLTLRRRVRRAVSRVLPERAMVQIERAYLRAQRPPTTQPGLSADVCMATDPASEIELPPAPRITLINDLLPFAYPRFFPPHVRAARQRAIARAVEASARLICPSEAVRTPLVDTLHVPTETTDVLEPRPPDARSDVRSEAHPPFLLVLAAYEPRANLLMLLTAFGIFVARHPDSDVRLVLTDQHLDLKRAIEAMRLSQRVEQRPAAAELFQQCLAVVDLQLYVTSYDPILQALAHAAPLLCSDAPAFRELAADAAVYVDPRKPTELADAIARVSTDDTLRTALSTAARQRTVALGPAAEAARTCLAAMRELTAEHHPMVAAGA